MNLSTILREIDTEIERLRKAKDLLSAFTTPKRSGRPAKSASIVPPAPAKRRRTLSPEAKAKIAEAQRKRWATQKRNVLLAEKKPGRKNVGAKRTAVKKAAKNTPAAG
jgi:hypothetical protein